MIQRIAVRTGILPETVNCWLLEGDPLTLVDTGPATAQAWQDLEQGLAGHGHRIDEIRRVIITHGHVDHYGQAQAIADVARCPVLAVAAEHQQLSSAYSALLEDGGADAWRRTYLGLGIPRECIDAMLDDFATLDRMRKPITHLQPLSNAFDVGALHFEVLPTPGHSRHHVSFFERAGRMLVGGDHLLVTDRLPNPLLEGTPPGGTRRRALPEYLESLSRIQALGNVTAYPGHYDAIPDASATAADLAARFRKRIERAAAVLGREGRTAYEVARELYPRMPARFAFLPVSMAAGCLDVLVAEGRASVRVVADVEEFTARAGVLASTQDP